MIYLEQSPADMALLALRHRFDLLLAGLFLRGLRRVAALLAQMVAELVALVKRPVALERRQDHEFEIKIQLKNFEVSRYLIIIFTGSELRCRVELT